MGLQRQGIVMGEKGRGSRELGMRSVSGLRYLQHPVTREKSDCSSLYVMGLN